MTSISQFGYQQQLKRGLSLTQLTAFGLNFMIPLGPAMILGQILKSSGGTVALPYLLAGIGMLFTAMSYAHVIRKIPLAGSLYNYFTHIFHPIVGLIGGWLILLDYILGPTTAVMSAALYAQQIWPHISYLSWLLFFSLIGLFNIFDMRLMSYIGLGFLLLSEAIVIISFIIWGIYITHHPNGLSQLFSMHAFHFSNWSNVASATSLAVLSYIGFDAISTLAEEAKHPLRDVPRAIYLSLIIGGLTMFVTGYLAVLTIPDWIVHANDPGFLDATLSFVAERTGGNWFKDFYDIGYLIAMVVVNFVGTAGASRLIYSMGRDGVLPKSIFSALSRWKTPYWNILLIIGLEIFIGITLQLEQVAELLNFGAITGFFILNIGVIWLFVIKKNDSSNVSRLRFFGKYIMAPLLGAGVMAWLFVNLKTTTLLCGTIWLIVGLIYFYWRKKNKYYEWPHCQME